jgi:deoxyadenosine/deoxycytidine kinase
MSSSKSGPIIVSVEGNIGSGKSTILDHLETSLGDLAGRVVVLKEPLGVWEAIKDPETGENILEKFYKDQTRYAFSFQVMAYASRLSLIRKAIEQNPECSVIVCERSLEADKHIFAKMLYDDGVIEDINYQIYQSFCKEFAREFGLDSIVYIDADAEVCHERVGKRSRQGDGGIPLEYLQKCKKYHDEWLLDTLQETPVLRIKTNQNATYDFEDPEDVGIKWLSLVKSFIEGQLNMPSLRI